MKRRYRVATIAMSLMALSAPSSAQTGDATRGERMYRACVACHSLEPNRDMTGPSLAEIWNRRSGSLPSFPRYSPALKSAGIIWTDDTLDEWIKDPQHFMARDAAVPMPRPRPVLRTASAQQQRQTCPLTGFLTFGILCF